MSDETASDLPPPRKKPGPKPGSRLSREMQSEITRDGTGRRKRTPLSAFQQKLQVRHCPPGYVARWVNDAPGRLAAALQGDYQFVTDEGIIVERTGTNAESDRRVSYVVDKVTGQKAYLMVIRQEFYDEDQRGKQKHLDKIEASLKAGQHDREPGDGRYSAEETARKGMVRIERAPLSGAPTDDDDD